MDDHNSKEARVEPGEWRIKASNKTPGESEKPVTAVMDLTCHSIYTSSALIRDTEMNNLHHPLHRMESPVFVFMQTGFFTDFHGS